MTEPDDGDLFVGAYIINLRSQMWRMNPRDLTPAQMKALAREAWEMYAAMKAAKSAATGTAPPSPS